MQHLYVAERKRESESERRESRLQLQKRETEDEEGGAFETEGKSFKDRTSEEKQFDQLYASHRSLRGSSFFRIKKLPGCKTPTLTGPDKY